MGEDIADRAVALLGIEEHGGASEEVELRACAMLKVALAKLEQLHGRERTVAIVGDAFSASAASDHEAATAALIATPAQQLTEALLTSLRRWDPFDPRQATAGHDEAGAMVLAGTAFLQERHGIAHTELYVSNLVRVLQDAARAGEEPISPPAQRAPVMPPPEGMVNLTPRYRAGFTLTERVNSMIDHLRASDPAEARIDVSASITACGMFLRERYGEAHAVEVLRQAEARVSQQAALDRWQPEPGSRPN